MVSILFLLLFNFGESSSIIVDKFIDFGHILLFGTASLVLLFVLNGRTWPVRKGSYYVIAFVAASAFGVATEFMQLMTPDRDFEIPDMIRDSLGALTFLIIAYPVRGPARGLLRITRATSVAVILLACTPTALAVLKIWLVEQDFPVVESFEHNVGNDLWKVGGAFAEISEAHATHGAYSLKTRLLPGIYPGLILERFHRDWRGYDTFSFDAFLEGTKPLNLALRINDAGHNEKYGDRFNTVHTLAPGHNHIVIRLPDVRSAPHTRLMDMRRIITVVVFSYLLIEQRTIYFDNFRLRLEKTSGG